MHLPQISVVLNWRNEQNVKGMYSIYLRITINRVSKYYKVETSQKVRTDEWTNHEDFWVKNTHSFAFEINSKIREKKIIIQNFIKRGYNFKKTVTFESIFSHLRQKGDRNSFYEFMQNYIKTPLGI